MDAVQVARKYLGQTEKPGNMGFRSPEFEAKMKAMGFHNGEPWCAYFAELVLKEAHPDKIAFIDSWISASTITTWNNAKKVASGLKLSNVPVVGAMVIFQNMKAGVGTMHGHTGIVTEVVSDVEFTSIEGNTNDDGSREGYEVAQKDRRIKPVQNGLQVKGFIVIV